MKDLENGVLKILGNLRTYGVPIHGATAKFVARILNIPEEEAKQTLDKLVSEDRASEAGGFYFKKLTYRY